MSLKHGWGAAALLLAGLTAAAWSDTARADGGACPAGGCATGSCETGGCATGNCGSCLTCCPKYYFTIEKAPKICFKTVCSKPVCDPCNIEGNGYYPTCWRPWAYPPNYSHCPVPPPGVLASQPPPLMAAPGVTTGSDLRQSDPLPAPRKTANPDPDR
jgi:hypothetical protein